jgi:hypothetical protein
MPCKKCRQSGHNFKTCPTRETKIKTEECIICYEEVGGENGEVTTKCGHKYCTTCFITHTRQKNKCAYCRTDICETPRSSLPVFSEALEERIINDCVNNQELKTEIIDHIKRRFEVSIMLHGGICTVEIANHIFDNEISFVFPMAIVSHNVLDTVTELRRRYEEI